MKKLYVGNLDYGINNDELADIFGQIGQVASAIVITDRDSGRSKGFGFVEMEDEDADKAIQELNGKEVKGRALTVNVARPKEEGGRNRRGGGFNRGGDRRGGNRNDGGRRYN